MCVKRLIDQITPEKRMKKKELLNYFDEKLMDKLYGFCYARTNDSHEAQRDAGYRLKDKIIIVNKIILPIINRQDFYYKSLFNHIKRYNKRLLRAVAFVFCQIADEVINNYIFFDFASEDLEIIEI